jgi:hypothetical protein
MYPVLCLEGLEKTTSKIGWRGRDWNQRNLLQSLQLAFATVSSFLTLSIASTPLEQKTYTEVASSPHVVLDSNQDKSLFKTKHTFKNILYR